MGSIGRKGSLDRRIIACCGRLFLEYPPIIATGLALSIRICPGAVSLRIVVIPWRGSEVNLWINPGAASKFHISFLLANETPRPHGGGPYIYLESPEGLVWLWAENLYRSNSILRT